MKTTYLRPNIITALVLSGLFALQFFIIGNTHISASGKVTQVRGMGSITTTHFDGATTLQVNWPILLVNVGVCYALAQALSLIALYKSIYRRPRLVYALLAVIISLAGLGLGTVFSKRYWGYFFERPSLPVSLNRLSAVNSIFSVKTVKNEAGIRRFVTRENASIEKEIAYCANDPYYCLSGRVLVFLEAKGLLPKAYSSIFPAELSMHKALSRSSLIRESEEGYDASLDFHGILVDGEDADGKRLYFLAVAGGQLSNDHYPYIESVWTVADKNALRMEDGQVFFYDFAGIEGLEWDTIWLFVSIAGLVVVLPVFAVVSGMISLFKGRAKKRFEPAL